MKRTLFSPTDYAVATEDALPYIPLSVWWTKPRVSRVSQPRPVRGKWQVFSEELSNRPRPHIPSPVVTLAPVSHSSILFAKRSSDTF